MKLLKIGELAKKASISVRTLHHYDSIDLLKPSDKSEAGYRLYNSADVKRLQQIMSLKSIGFSLETISQLLDEGSTLLKTLEMQNEVIERKLFALKKVHQRIQMLLSRFDDGKDAKTSELLQLIKEMNDMENIYTPKQLKTLQERLEKYKDKAKEVENAWPILFGKFEKAMNDGLDPASTEVQELAKHAQHFIDLFTGGDKAIEANLDKAYETNRENALRNWGVSREVFEYATKARAILKGNDSD